MKKLRFQVLLHLEFYLAAAFYAVSTRLNSGRSPADDASFALWLDFHPARPRWW